MSNDQTSRSGDSIPSKHPASLLLWRGFALAIGVAVLGIAGYTCYVAFDEPDRQETLVLGQNRLAIGSPIGLRVLVRHRTSGSSVEGAVVELALANGRERRLVGKFTTGSDGCILSPIALPDVPAGDYTLVIDARSRLGTDHIERRVELYPPRQILLTTDKPLYQPGQTIHLRALVSNGRTLKPFAGEAVTFEVSDAKGNRVSRETRTTSAFGIVSADFTLATEVNLGRYKVQARASSAVAERAVEVKRYVLPKFEIAITTDQPFYRPGQTISGTVTARYFFGKAVKDADVRIEAKTMHETSVAIGDVTATTDVEGKAAFKLSLPEHFVGMPQKDGQAFLDLTAEVRDTAGHVERATLSLGVTDRELVLTALPEAGRLVPGVENMVYVLAAHPDGRPAECDVLVDGKQYRTDATGVAVVPVTPPAGEYAIRFNAREAAGKSATAVLSNEAGAVLHPILLRTDKAVYEVGQAANVTILCASSGTVFLDLVRDGQTVLTRSVDVRNGRGDVSVPLPSDLVGAIRIHSYVTTKHGEDFGATRLIYVNPASGLDVRAEADKPVYRPGETAKVQFTIVDASGTPTPGALGISAVDESVFALHENRPGLLQQFMEVEGELLKPRYQLKFFDSPSRLLSSASRNPPLAQAWFASLNTPDASQADIASLSEYLGSGFSDRLQRSAGTPEFDELLSKPEYAEAARLVRATRGGYTLREATGPLKERAVERARAVYFKRLKTILTILGGALICVVPLGLLFIGGFQNLRRDPGLAHLRENDHRAMETVVRAHYMVSALFLAQLIWYPCTLLLFEVLHMRMDDPSMSVLAGEALLVASVLALRFAAARRLRSTGYEREANALSDIGVAYAVQFVFTRAGLFEIPGVHEVLGWTPPGNAGAVCFLLALILPFAIIGWSSLWTRRLLTAREVRYPLNSPPQFSAVVLFLVVIFIMGGMLLPSLAKAKAKAHRVSAMNDLRNLGAAIEQWKLDSAAASDSPVASAAPRVRRDFPETLFWQPELITDEHGRATIEIPLADSITTWSTSFDAISAGGKLGSGQVPIRVFQDFFIELDLPVSLNLGDEISVPIICHNYLTEPQTIHLTLDGADWLASARREISVKLAANEVRAAHFSIQAQRVGSHPLKVIARGEKLSDAIERELRVLPTGDAFEQTDNGTLRELHEYTFDVPATAIPGSAGLVVKLYPSQFTEIVEGLDSIFKAPFGCFEQTSSATYPNVLTLDYLKSVERLTPEIEVKARKLINAGYQRLLTFEVPGGGFDWFGNPPANICLTAYGVLEFTDMARVHPVDPAVIVRAQGWLAGKQNSDGSWDEIRNRGWTWAGRGSITAFVAWALAESGDRSDCLVKALAYLEAHPGELDTTYAKALAANAFLAASPVSPFGRQLVGDLHRRAVRSQEGRAFWCSSGSGMTYSTGAGLNVETTALAALALMKSGEWQATATEALMWISEQKKPQGDWGYTQATILAMRALLKGSGTSPGREGTSTITITLNGRHVQNLEINKQNSDVLRMVSLTDKLATGVNRIGLRQAPTGELAFQITGAFWSEANSVANNPAPQAEPLDITVDYDRTSLRVHDTIECRVTVQNRTTRDVPMAIVDLGIPPGFDAAPASFERMVRDGSVAKFELTGAQALLYLRELRAGEPLRFAYDLRAKYPLRVASPKSSVYEYYTPTNRAWSAVARLEVTD